MRYALTGYRVLDFGWVAAGPLTGKLLADLGAEVIKIESRKRIDTTRFTPENKAQDPEKDPVFHAINRNKLGITLDITQPEAVALLKRLTKISDVVIENFFPGTMKRLGLDYESLCKERADLIMISLPGLGLEGSLSQTPAYAMTLSALAGLDSVVGYRGERALGIQQPFSDNNSAIHGVVAVLAAIIHRNRTGEGQFIELAQIESLISCLGEAVMDFVMNERNSETQGTDNSVMAPHGNYPCKGEDKWVSIAVKTEGEWRSLCQAMDNPEMLQSEKFSDMYSRLKNRDELNQIVTNWTLNYTSYEVMKILQRSGVAACPCMDIDERYLDPHFEDREVFTFCDHPATGTDVIPNLSWKMGVSNGSVYRPAPMMGEHNYYVFGELLGMSKQEIKSLEECSIIY